MTRAVAVVVLAAFASLAALAQQTPPRQEPAPRPTGTAMISGVVVVFDTDAPVRGATVRLTTPNDRWETTTDTAGRFEFRDLPINIFTIGVTKAGFVSQTIPLAERGIGTIQPGTNVRMEIPLVRGAAIAGRVMDHYGDPAAGVTVSAMRLYYDLPGLPRVRMAGLAQTNDLGEYRLYGLDPATYFVATGSNDALRQFWSADVKAPRGPATLPPFTAPRLPAPVFFPGTTHSAEARPIVLGPGAQMPGTDIRLTNAGLVHLGGRVVDSFGSPVDDIYVILNPAASTGAIPNTSRVATTDGSGSFAFPDVAPGEYSLMAVALATPLGVAAREKGMPSTERGLPEFATERISVFADQTGVQVQTRPGVDVRGRIMVDGVPVHPSLGSEFPLGISARPVRPPEGMTSSLFTTEAVVNRDGTFILKGTGGHRVISVSGIPSGSFLARVTAGGVDITDDGIDMRQAAASGLGIELTTKPAVLDVFIVDASGTRRTGSFIVFADDPQLWTKYSSRHLTLRNTSVSSGRTARINDLPAGRYLVALIGPGERQNWADPAFLERLRTLATPVTLVAGETRSVSVQWR